MATNTQQKAQTPETPETIGVPPSQALKEWRQVMIAEGVAPNQVDRALLERGDVPAEVKDAIKKEENTGVENTPAMGPEGAPAAPSPDGVEATATDTEADAPISGEVGLLSTTSEIDQIKAETMKNLGEEGISEVKPETSVPDHALEVAEKKEDPAAGPAEDAAGVDSRLSTGVAGYSVTEDVARKSQNISEKGSVTDAKTWQAALVQRLIETWGSLKGIFS